MVRSTDSRTRLTAMLGVFTLVCAVGTAEADFIFGEAANLGPAVNSAANEYAPSFSTDGLELYFSRGGTPGNTWIARRATPDSEWEPAVDIGPPVNLADNGAEFLTADGLTLFLSSNRPGTHGAYDLWVTTRPTRDASWATPVNLGATVNSSSEEWGLSLSSDYLELYFTSNRPGGQGNLDLWMTTRATLDDDWSPPVNLGPSVNTSAHDAFPSISSDGLLLFFASTRSGASNMDLYMMRRPTTRYPWGPPTNLGPRVNSPATDNGPKLSADGSMLCFFSFRAGGFGAGDIWQIPLTRIVDFNGDGQVNGFELFAMADRWGTDDLSCDIGPMPWGDGVVDVEDLKVLAEFIGEEMNDPTLVAHWALDEMEGVIAYDGTGEKDGAVIGGATWHPEEGAVDGALEFNGIDAYVETSPVLNPVDGAFSVLAWVKGGAPGQAIVSQQDHADWLGANTSTGVLWTGLKAARRGGPLVSETVITDGTWHRIGFTWDGSTRSLYVDGVLVAQDGQDSLEGSDVGLYIGCGAKQEANSFFSGLIDDVRIYNRAVRP